MNEMFATKSGGGGGGTIIQYVDFLPCFAAAAEIY